MKDGSETVGQFMQKKLTELYTPVKFNYRDIIEAGMPDMNKVKSDLERLLEEERFDWDDLKGRAPSDGVRDALERARIIEGGGQKSEVTGEMEEFLQLGEY
jgi:hypothetical protein